MKELGKLSEAKHQQIGKILDDFMSRFDLASAIFVGEFANYYSSGVTGHKEQVQVVEKVEDVAKSQLDSYQTIFVKGSRSIALGKLFS